jgi:transposase
VEGVMQIVYECCAGLDVHKKSVVACRIRTKPNGHIVQETRTFGTTTAELLRLLDWLLQWGCTHVALESTGEYWKPVYNILEGNLEIVLVNAHHIKSVPGRKTDVKDAEWLADLLRHGLLRGSFVPPQPQRDLRDLTRQRSNLVRERAAVVNRLQKVLEGANIKLTSVLTDVLGVSARAILGELIAGTSDPAVLADLAQGKLRAKRVQLEQALLGYVRDHHRFLLISHLEHIDFLDEQVGVFDAQIAVQLVQMSSPPTPALGDQPSHPALADADPAPESLSFTDAVALLDTIPGINRTLAETLVAEIGTDMQRFPSAAALAAWSGVAPGNNESAGKQRTGRTRPGNPALRKGLAQAAHGAARKKDSYLQALYHRLAGRRGKKRALTAVAHSIVVAIYHMFLRKQPYHELGGTYFDERKRESVANRLVKRLERLGYQVALEMPSVVPALMA